MSTRGVCAHELHCNKGLICAPYEAVYRCVPSSPLRTGRGKRVQCSDKSKLTSLKKQDSMVVLPRLEQPVLQTRSAQSLVPAAVQPTCISRLLRRASRLHDRCSLSVSRQCCYIRRVLRNSGTHRCRHSRCPSRSPKHLGGCWPIPGISPRPGHQATIKGIVRGRRAPYRWRRTYYRIFLSISR